MRQFSKQQLLSNTEIFTIFTLIFSYYYIRDFFRVIFFLYLFSVAFSPIHKKYLPPKNHIKPFNEKCCMLLSSGGKMVTWESHSGIKSWKSPLRNSREKA